MKYSQRYEVMERISLINPKFLNSKIVLFLLYLMYVFLLSILFSTWLRLLLGSYVGI